MGFFCYGVYVDDVDDEDDDPISPLVIFFLLLYRSEERSVKWRVSITWPLLSASNSTNTAKGI